MSASDFTEVVRGKELYSGKAKSVYATNHEDLLIMLYRNDTSAFDGKKLAKLDNKGRVNNQFNAVIMQKLEEAGIRTHFVKLLSENESLVRKLTMIPVECVIRNIAAGSLCRRLGIQEGMTLNPPTFEFFLKNDALGDPMINEYHIDSFHWATPAQIARMKTLAFATNNVLQELFLAGNMLLVDFKLEFGLYKGEVVLADEITPDGCRIWDKDTREKLDKDRFRQDLGNVVESYQIVGQRLGMHFG
jgi:phosphoribosylaminoimidazole-succinocarboxamide synthase